MDMDAALMDMDMAMDMELQTGKTMVMVILIRLLLHTRMKDFRQNGRNEDMAMVLVARMILAIANRALLKVSIEVIHTFTPLLHIQLLAAPMVKVLVQVQYAVAIRIQIQTRTHLDTP